MWYSVYMKLIDHITDQNVFLNFSCSCCEVSINPSELVECGVPMCEEHGEMEYNDVNVIVREGV